MFYSVSLLSTLSVATLSTAVQATETWNSGDLDNFIDGATIMAAGGGGSPKIAKKLLDQYFTVSDTVQLNNIGDIIKGKGYSATAVGAIGSPAELFKLPDPLGLPSNAYVALDLTFNHFVTPINYLMPIEVGAINGLYPFLLASKLNNENLSDVISVLNVDGGGRSVPTLPLLIYSYFPNIYNQQAAVISPTASIVPPFPYPSEWALLQAPSGNQGNIEATILAMLGGADSPYKGAAGYGSFYANADNISTSPPVTGQLLVAHDAGKAYKSSPTGSSVAASLNSSGRQTKVVFSGTITNITLDTQGLDYGMVTITGSGANAGDTFSIQYENENICAYKNSYSTATPFVLGPDSVAYVPTNGTIFDNSDLYTIFKEGGKPVVDIVAIQASSQITKIPGIMQAWEAVRTAIPENKCNFPYATPWLGSTEIGSIVLGQANGSKH